MRDLQIFFNGILNIFSAEFTLYGVTVSLWQLFIYGWLLAICGTVIYKLMDK